MLSDALSCSPLRPCGFGQCANVFSFIAPRLPYVHLAYHYAYIQPGYSSPFPPHDPLRAERRNVLTTHDIWLKPLPIYRSKTRRNILHRSLGTRSTLHVSVRLRLLFGQCHDFVRTTMMRPWSHCPCRILRLPKWFLFPLFLGAFPLFGQVDDCGALPPPAPQSPQNDGSPNGGHLKPVLEGPLPEGETPTASTCPFLSIPPLTSHQKGTCQRRTLPPLPGRCGAQRGLSRLGT